MQTCLSSEALTLAIPLHDENSTCYEATAVEYRIVDQADTELVARVSLAGFASGDTQAVIAIDGAINTIAAGAYRELRSVELFLTVTTGTIKLTHEYIVEAASVLALGVNSFQGYNAALLTGFDIPNLPKWNDASKSDRIAAMISAWRNIGRLYLRYFAEENDQSRIIFITSESGNLTALTADQFGYLPVLMKTAVYRAQVMEADYILGNDDMDAIRSSGIISRAVGESTDVYVPTRPYAGPVCTRVLKELGRYIVHSKRVGRG